MSILNSSLSMVIKSDSVLTEKTVVDNGEYDANQEGYDGYSKVNVGVTEFSKIDGINYQIASINPIVESGRFWTNWRQTQNILPIDSEGNRIKIDWANDDWELGYAVLMKDEIIRTAQTCPHGAAQWTSYWGKAPVSFLAHTNYASDPYATFTLRVSATTCVDKDLWEPNTGFSEGMLPDTWYFIKASYNATTHTASITATKDFVNWSETGSVTQIDKIPYTGNDDYMGFAGHHTVSAQPAQNVILDLANTYIKQNGIIVWGNFDGKFSDKYTSQEAI